MENSASRIDYDKDILKHSVRIMGWLPACAYRFNRISRENRPLKYFTFCASNAIDVFMLEREGIIQRNTKTDHLDGVYYCEEDPDEFRKIAELVGSEAQGFLDRFDNLACFQESRATRGKSFYDNDAEFFEERLRRKLRTKENHRRFRAAFPFDVINLDVCGTIFPPKAQNIVSPMMQSIRNILQWQKGPDQKGNQCNAFTLFLTSHVHPAELNEDAVNELVTSFNTNLSSYIQFNAAFVNRYPFGDAEQFANGNFSEFFSLALPKIIVQDANRAGWDVTYDHIFLYTRPRKTHPYQIMSSIARFRRAPELSQILENPLRQRYIDEVTAIVSRGPKWLNACVENQSIAGELKQNLAEVVKFRKETLSKLT